MSDTIAVVGLGNAGDTLHLPALAAIEGVQVVGGCDVVPETRDRISQRWSIPVFDDFDGLLDETGPDVVIIATPPDTHRDYTIQALRAGAHVICEKPFVSSLAEADEVIAVAEEVGKRVALNHEFREMPIFRALREEVARPEVGPPVFAQVWQLMDLPPWAEPGWRGQMLQRTLYEAGIHLVDYLMSLFGEKPNSVQARTSTCGVREGETDAVALATLEFSDGRLAQIVQNRLCKGETQYFEVRADTRSRSLRASFGGRARLTAGLLRDTRPHVRFEFGASGIAWSEVGNKRRFLARNPSDAGMIATRVVLEKSLEAFRSGDRLPISAEDGRDVLEVIAAAYHSQETGRRVSLDPEVLRDLRSLQMGALPRGGG